MASLPWGHNLVLLHKLKDRKARLWHARAADLFQDLLNLTRALSDEQQRHIRENLSEEELTVFDLLTRPGPDLSPVERDEVKKVAKLLLERLKSVIVLDWRRRNDARAKVRLAIEDALDEGLPSAYTPDVYQQKCSPLFEHVFESYGGVSGDRLIPPPPRRPQAWRGDQAFFA